MTKFKENIFSSTRRYDYLNFKARHITRIETKCLSLALQLLKIFSLKNKVNKCNFKSIFPYKFFFQITSWLKDLNQLNKSSRTTDFFGENVF